MGGILECKEEFIQARKPFTEFLSLNREGKEGYAQFKAILTQLSPAWGLRPLGYCSCIRPPSPTDLMSKNWILFCLWWGSLKRAPYSQGWELCFKVRNYKNWALVCSVFVFFWFDCFLIYGHFSPAQNRTAKLQSPAEPSSVTAFNLRVL